MYETTNLLVRLCNIADEGRRMPSANMSLPLFRRGESLEKELGRLSVRPERPDYDPVAYISENSSPIDLICSGSDAEEMKALRGSPRMIAWNSSHIVPMVGLDYPSLTKRAAESCSEWPKPFLINSLEGGVLWSVYGETFLAASRSDAVPVSMVKRALEKLIRQHGLEAIRREIVSKCGAGAWESYRKDIFLLPKKNTLGELARFSAGGSTRVRMRAMTEEESMSSRFAGKFKKMFGMKGGWLACAMVPERIYSMYPQKDKERLVSYIDRRGVRFRWCRIRGKIHAAIAVLGSCKGECA